MKACTVMCGLSYLYLLTDTSKGKVMNVKNLYLAIIMMSIVAFMATMVPQLAAHGFDPMALMHALISTPISTGLTLNVFIACVCLIVLNHTEGRTLGIKTWIPTLAFSVFGIATGLSVYLYLRERVKEQA
jgi:Protein of unknown function DUF2834